MRKLEKIIFNKIYLNIQKNWSGHLKSQIWISEDN